MLLFDPSRWTVETAFRLSRTVLIAALLTGTVVGLGVAVWLLPPLLVQMDATASPRSSAVASARQAMLWASGGVLAIVGLVFTWRRDVLARQAAALEQDANFTGRYTEAIAQLGDEKLAVRLGGIYALERIAQDSLRDRQTIVDVLVAYLREQQAREPDERDSSTLLDAIIEVIRRTSLLEGPQLRWSLSGLDLTSANLTRANLRGARLLDTDLSGALLHGAILDRAVLFDTKFNRAVMTRASLRGVQTFSTDFTGARLQDARFDGSNLRSSRFSDEARAQARGDSRTVWPDGFTPNLD